MQSSTQKWEVSATSSKLNGVKADQAWSLLAGSYYDLHKYAPSIVVASKKVSDGIRHVTFTRAGSPTVYWSKERLLKMDQDERAYTYESVENTLGLVNMVSKVRVVPAGTDSCAVEWSLVSEPAPGLARSDLTSLLQAAASDTAKKVGEFLRSGAK
ncbi:lachrymatory-factor synthase [Iris pallida]|uniref:Lachrymatory-factor synthase n=1 Tax=Iris pallida TaxID=29817 RepID=A0AAX6HCF2_IRIPA|nr:lachrymatory-factor synthase [Iris pallida]KAJ6838261.1 lachrymatory-factor synthase [Iris pallida]